MKGQYFISDDVDIKYYEEYEYEDKSFTYYFDGNKSFIIFKTPTSLVPPDNIFNLHFDTIPPYLGYLYHEGSLCISMKRKTHSTAFSSFSKIESELDLGSPLVSKLIIELAATIQFLHQRNIILDKLNFKTLYVDEFFHDLYIFKYGFPELCNNRTMKDDEDDFQIIFKHFYLNTYKIIQKKHPHFLSNLSYSIISGEIKIDKASDIEEIRQHYWDLLQGKNDEDNESKQINIQNNDIEKEAIEEDHQPLRQYIYKGPIFDSRFIPLPLNLNFDTNNQLFLFDQQCPNIFENYSNLMDKWFKNRYPLTYMNYLDINDPDPRNDYFKIKEQFPEAQFYIRYIRTFNNLNINQQSNNEINFDDYSDNKAINNNNNLESNNNSSYSDFSDNDSEESEIKQISFSEVEYPWMSYLELTQYLVFVTDKKFPYYTQILEFGAVNNIITVDEFYSLYNKNAGLVPITVAFQLILEFSPFMVPPLGAFCLKSDLISLAQKGDAAALYRLALYGQEDYPNESLLLMKLSSSYEYSPAMFSYGLLTHDISLIQKAADKDLPIARAFLLLSQNHSSINLFDQTSKEIIELFIQTYPNSDITGDIYL